MDSLEEKRETKPVPTFAELDAMADFHARLSTLESRQVSMSRRITQLEDLNIGSRRDSDELFDNKTMGIILILMVLPIIVPLLGDMVAQWRSSS